MKRLNQRGYNLVELSIAVLILSAMASSVMVARSFVARQTVRTGDKAFATQKAIQMFEELKALAAGLEKTGTNVLDQYSDGSLFNTVLTTDKKVDTGLVSADPGNPLSGNRRINGHWRYLRQIQIKKVANDPYARQVFITIWRYQSDQNPGQPGEVLSQVGGILRTITSVYPPTQVMDVYVLSINNIQGWWAQIPTLYNTFQSIIADIGGRNPGLEIRPHYITRSSYGRDLSYIPYINQSNPTDAAATTIPKVYFYPGLVPQDQPSNGCGCDAMFYDPSPTGVQVDGNFNVDGSFTSTTSQFSGCPSYAVADQYNHSMRYPDELQMYASVTAAYGGGTTLSVPVTEISERMLLEGMLSTPQSYTNALIVNLHGELLPMPPMRNYSDAAKEPSGKKDVRLVTHPELLYYPSDAGGSVTVKLRVYGYYDGLDDISQLDAKHPDPQVLDAGSVYFPDVLIQSNKFAVTAVYGSGTTAYGVTQLAVSQAGPAGVSWVWSSPNGTDTLLTLYNTPLRCPQYAPGGTPTGKYSGLNASDRLYGLEYIPCSPENVTAVSNFNSVTFTARDLLSTLQGPGAPKNTARWVIAVRGMPAGQINFETRIGSSIGSGYPNLSGTYVWVGKTNPPPYTERFQYLGDPRHMPYLDCKAGGPSIAGAAATITADSYNWYFKNFGASVTVDGYVGFDQAGNVTGWGGDGNTVDVPRYFKTFRDALLNTTSIWSTMNGWSYYYYGMGGEIGSDQPPYSHSVSIYNTLWQTTTAGAALSSVNEMINQEPIQNKKVVSNTTNTWFAKYWMGELYPDSMYDTWQTAHNLPGPANAATSLTFYRRDFTAVPRPVTNPTVNGFTANAQRDRTGTLGCTSFFNGVTSGSTKFNHVGEAGGTSNILSLATTCYGLFNYPLAGTVNCTRPWTLNEGGNQPTEWNIAPYNSTRTSLQNPSISGESRLFYDSSNASYNGTGVIKITSTSGGVSQTAYVVESGLDISAEVGTSALGKTALVFLLRTFLDGGQYTGTSHIYQVPLIKTYVDSVNYQYFQPNAIGITISGAVTTLGGSGLSVPTTNVWYRYPGLTSSMANFYTEEYPGYPNLLSNTYVETVAGSPMTFNINLKYSKDLGKTWGFIQDNQPAIKGLLDMSLSHKITSNTIPVTYSWNVSNASTFPQGNYLIMSEVYRTQASGTLPLNYAYHTVEVSITR